jgi:hypothetical protein
MGPNTAPTPLTDDSRPPVKAPIRTASAKKQPSSGSRSCEPTTNPWLVRLREFTSDRPLIVGLPVHSTVN